MDEMHVNKSEEKMHILQSKNIFCNEDRTPIVFHVLPSPDHDEIVQLIKAGGGAVIDGGNIRSTEVITISSGLQNMESIERVISSSYIYACCFNGELIDMDEFRFTPDDADSDVSVKENGSESGADFHYERLSLEEVHKILMYIVKCENMWKEMYKNKVYSKPWKATQRSFALWALEKFYQIASLNRETSCGTSLQDDKHQTKNDCIEVSPTQTSRVDIHTEFSNMVENGKREEMQHGMKKENSSSAWSKKKLSECSLQSKDTLSEGSENESEKEEDISLCAKRKRIAGRMSVVIDEESKSESEEQEVGSKCQEGEGVNSNLSISSEKEVVGEVKIEKYSIKQKLKKKNRDQDEKDCQQSSSSSVKRTPPNLMTTKKVMGLNISVSPNKSWRKDNSNINLGKKEKVLTSTPISGSAHIQNDMNSSMEDEVTGNDCSPSHAARKSKISNRLRLYSYKEDMELLRWLCYKRKRSHDTLSGNRIWQFMESKKVIAGRSWQSMKERFRRHIAPNLKDYPLPKMDLHKLTLKI